jgi:hypothetical protein
MNLILYSGYHDEIHTDEQQHAIVILWGYILYFDFKTFATKCEVKIVVL